MILYDGPYAKNMIKYGIENGCDEPKAKHNEATSNIDDEKLENDSNSSCELKRIIRDFS